MRSIRSLTAAGVATLLLPLAAAPSQAAGAGVTVANMSFSPARVVVGVGETVTWTFADPTSHTVTSDDGFFDVGPASGGATRTVRFRSAGSFGYHCSIHPTMVGRVAVRVSVSGSRTEGWRLRWLAGENPNGRTYDVQTRRKGTSTWTFLRRGTTAGTAHYEPGGSAAWQVRARTVKGAEKSGWSPVSTLS